MILMKGLVFIHNTEPKFDLSFVAEREIDMSIYLHVREFLAPPLTAANSSHLGSRGYAWNLKLAFKLE